MSGLGASDIAAIVRKRLAYAAGIPASSIADDRSLESLGLDTLDIIELLLWCERHFALTLPDDANDAATLAALVAVIEAAHRRAEERRPAPDLSTCALDVGWLDRDDGSYALQLWPLEIPPAAAAPIELILPPGLTPGAARDLLDNLARRIGASAASLAPRA